MDKKNKKIKEVVASEALRDGYFADSYRLTSDKPRSNLTLAWVWNKFVKINGIKLSHKKRCSDQSVFIVILHSFKIWSLQSIKLSLILRYLIICPRDGFSFFHLLL